MYRDNLEETRDDFVVKQLRRDIKMNGGTEFDEYGRPIRRPGYGQQQPGLNQGIQQQQPGYNQQGFQQQPMSGDNLDFSALSEDLKRQQRFIEQDRVNQQQRPYFEPQGQPQQGYQPQRPMYFEPQGQPQPQRPVQQPLYVDQYGRPIQNYQQPQPVFIQGQGPPVQVPPPPQNPPSRMPPARIPPYMPEVPLPSVPKKKRIGLAVVIVILVMVIIAFIGSLVYFYSKFGGKLF